jgi:hypothetical protein
MLNCWIFAGDVPIGQTSLTLRDRSMGVVGDDFRPTLAYNAVRAQIQATSLDNQSDQILLTARTEGGEPLNTVAGVRIADVPDVEVLEVTLLGLDSASIRRFFGV